MCPDFPKISGGATPAEVWAYATRELTGLTGTPRSNLLGEDATFEAGVGARKSKIDNVDATVSSRSTLTQAQILSDSTPFQGGRIDAAITSRSSHAAADIWTVGTRQLTALTGTPRTDILGEDASFEAGSGARKSRIDKTPAFVTPTEASIVMDGTEKILFEITDVKSAEVEAWVDLTPMAGGDIIVIRYSRKMKAVGAAYAKYAEETYSGAQTIPALCIMNKKIYRDTKVTAQQTGGTNRTLDVQVIRAAEA